MRLRLWSGLMHEAALKSGEDPDRLSFLHAVRVIRRKMAIFGAIPPLRTNPNSITKCWRKSSKKNAPPAAAVTIRVA